MVWIYRRYGSILYSTHLLWSGNLPAGTSHPRISCYNRGIAQTWVSVKTGMWYARSAEFLQEPMIVTFKWLRVVGDTIFAVGALALAWFIFGLKGGWSLKK